MITLINEKSIIKIEIIYKMFIIINIYKYNNKSFTGTLL